MLSERRRANIAIAHTTTMLLCLAVAMIVSTSTVSAGMPAPLPINWTAESTPAHVSIPANAYDGTWHAGVLAALLKLSARPRLPQ